MTVGTSLTKLSYNFAKTNGVVIVDFDNTLNIVIRKGSSPDLLSEVIRHSSLPVKAKLVEADEFESTLNTIYSNTDEATTTLLDDAEQNLDLSMLLNEIPKSADLLESENDAPIIKMINALLAQAVRDQASDIHIEPFETRSVVRYRIDGTLIDVIEPNRALHAAMISRIKVMAQLDIAEKRLPQDGRITLYLAGRPIDVRVSTLPTGHGERVVMRLLDKSAGRLDLNKLGMDTMTLNTMQDFVSQPHGIVLVTGPTGSGKTTTLYAALASIDSSVTNVMSVEDPVEYDIDGISQTQVNSRIDMTFARALRAILRQDPDVIMIGEVRDLETAQIAVQSSLTGHLVLATLHTNDSVSAVTRLTDMGIEPFLLSSSLVGVLSQRLIRLLCPNCKTPYEPDEVEKEILRDFGIPSALYKATGCSCCNQTGYKGRTGIYELMKTDDRLRTMIHSCVSEQTLRAYTQESGMKNLRDDGLRWAFSGHTSIEEVIRVTRD